MRVLTTQTPIVPKAKQQVAPCPLVGGDRHVVPPGNRFLVDLSLGNTRQRQFGTGSMGLGMIHSMQCIRVCNI